MNEYIFNLDLRKSDKPQLKNKKKPFKVRLEVTFLTKDRIKYTIDSITRKGKDIREYLSNEHMMKLYSLIDEIKDIF